MGEKTGNLGGSFQQIVILKQIYNALRGILGKEGKVNIYIAYI